MLLNQTLPARQPASHSHGARTAPLISGLCWLQLARLLDANRDQYDAFLVAHGTDTMA